jgi:hypothetical protein
VIIKNTAHATVPAKWLGMEGSVSWAFRSPDLTLRNFFFWSFVRNCAYLVKTNPEAG